MGQPYSLDLRERIVAYVALGHSARAAAEVFNVSASTAIRFVAAARDTGSVAPKPQGRPAGRFGKLACHRAFLIEVVQCEPDITLQELTDALMSAEGVRVALSSLHSFLRRHGYRYKKRPDRPGTRTRDRTARPAGLDRQAATAHA